MRNHTGGPGRYLAAKEDTWVAKLDDMTIVIQMIGYDDRLPQWQWHIYGYVGTGIYKGVCISYDMCRRSVIFTLWARQRELKFRKVKDEK
jgi:hypothetical protein